LRNFSGVTVLWPRLCSDRGSKSKLVRLVQHCGNIGCAAAGWLQVELVANKRCSAYLHAETLIAAFSVGESQHTAVQLNFHWLIVAQSPGLVATRQAPVILQQV